MDFGEIIGILKSFFGDVVDYVKNFKRSGLYKFGDMIYAVVLLIIAVGKAFG